MGTEDAREIARAARQQSRRACTLRAGHVPDEIDEMLQLRANWLSGHHLQRRGRELTGLVVLAAALQVAAAVGLAYVAGFSAVHDVLGRVSWPWIGAAGGGLVVSFPAYYFAYRGIYEVEDGHELARRQMMSVVTGGFGGFFAHGGAALDDYALRAAGADERDASVRVSALAGMEHGALAVLGTAAGIVVLVQGLAKPPPDFSLPWSVIPIPGFALAFWLAARYRARLRDRGGWRGKMGVFLDSIHLNRLLFLHHQAHRPTGRCGCADGRPPRDHLVQRRTDGRGRRRRLRLPRAHPVAADALLVRSPADASSHGRAGGPAGGG